MKKFLAIFLLAVSISFAQTKEVNDTTVINQKITALQNQMQQRLGELAQQDPTCNQILGAINTWVEVKKEKIEAIKKRK